MSRLLSQESFKRSSFRPSAYVSVYIGNCTDVYLNSCTNLKITASLLSSTIRNGQNVGCWKRTPHLFDRWNCYPMHSHSNPQCHTSNVSGRTMYYVYRAL